MSMIAETAVSNTSYSFDMLFSYAIPENFKVDCGCRVLVPFGKGNTHRMGIVMKKRSGSIKGLKKIISVIDDKPVISAEMIELATHLRDYTFCTYYDALKIMLPPAMNIQIREKIRINRDFKENELLGTEALELFEKLRKFPDDRQVNEFISGFISENGRKIVDELCES
nr:primosomal protein N' [Ruminococcus sp.]